MRTAQYTLLIYMHRLLRLSALFTAISALSFSAAADDRQYKVESAYLYSFFNYITWPGYGSPQKMTNPLICLSGRDPVVPYLEYIRDKMKEERQLTIRIVNEDDTISGCHIFFIRHRLSSRLLSMLPNDTLVVFKPDDPLDRGGMVELSEDGERIAIRINQQQLEEKNFQVSSRLLDLAQKVR